MLKPRGRAAGETERRRLDELTKLCAENRLRAELRRDRQRELDLRRSGVIRSISEDRAGRVGGGVSASNVGSRCPRDALHEVETHRKLQPRPATVQNHARSAVAVPGVPPRSHRRHISTIAYDRHSTEIADTLMTSTGGAPKTRVEDESAKLKRRENDLRFVSVICRRDAP